MTFTPCSHEKEVAQLLARGLWPQACSAELSAHVSACRSCGDLLLVSQLFRQARTEAASEAPLASPGASWWRAQLCRRNAAVERISRPILGAQIFAQVANLLVATVFLISQARHSLGWFAWLEQLPQSSALHFEKLWTSMDKLSPVALFTSGWSSALTISALASLLLFGGVAVYLATEKE
jgi:hypothetical protein